MSSQRSVGCASRCIELPLHHPGLTAARRSGRYYSGSRPGYCELLNLGVSGESSTAHADGIGYWLIGCLVDGELRHDQVGRASRTQRDRGTTAAAVESRGLERLEAYWSARAART